jgi:hypothetical protein
VLERLARQFKVSTLVVLLRRLYDAQRMNRDEYQEAIDLQRTGNLSTAAVSVASALPGASWGSLVIGRVCDARDHARAAVRSDRSNVTPGR